MLTKDLLEVEKRKPHIRPRYREVDTYLPVARRVIDCYDPGRTRGEIEAAVEDLETHDTFKFVRGLSAILDRRAEFEQRSPVPPADLRAAVFDRGHVTTAAERRRVLETVGDQFGLSPSAVEGYFWADRESEAVLVEAPSVDPESLIRRYNLSLTQTLLFDAHELAFTVSTNFQEVFGHVAYLGLMYSVDEDLTVHVTGPASLFDRARTYGTSLAKLLPTVARADEWHLTADVETEVGGEARIYEFELDSSAADCFPDLSTTPSFDSEVERDFAVRVRSLLDGWTVTREPTILRSGRRVMIPDFSFERHGDGHEFYLEVVGFWTPAYLEEKLAKVRAVESEAPLVLAVDESLNCTDRDFAGGTVDQVFFYRDRIPVKPVLERINEIDRRAVEADRRRLADEPIDLDDDQVHDVDDLAAAQGVTPDAMEGYLADERPGEVSNGKYVPPATMERIGGEIAEIGATTLAEANRVLERYGLAQGILEALGFEVRYVSLDQAEASIRPVDR